MQTDAVVVLSVTEALQYDAFLALQQQLLLQPEMTLTATASNATVSKTRKSHKLPPQTHHKSCQTTQALARGGGGGGGIQGTTVAVGGAGSGNKGDSLQPLPLMRSSKSVYAFAAGVGQVNPASISGVAPPPPPTTTTSSSSTSSKRSRKSASSASSLVSSTASSTSTLATTTTSSLSVAASTCTDLPTAISTSTASKNSSKKNAAGTRTDSKGKKRATANSSSFSIEPEVASASFSHPVRTTNRNLDKNLLFNLNYTKNLAAKYPDPYWPHSCDDDVIIEDDEDVEMCTGDSNATVHVQKPGEIGNGMISHINKSNPLQLLRTYDIREPGPIAGIVLSPDGSMLATFSTVGTAKLWDVHSGKLVMSLKDEKEPDIDEFYVGRFIPDSSRIVVGGKLKDRNRWSEQDDDNHILPCPLKVFDVVKGKVIATLNGHEEEILCVKSLQFKNENYYITSSQDGYIIKWKVKEDWTTLVEKVRFHDDITCMAFTISFLPNTGNKYFIGACDDNIRLYDFESGQLMQTFEGIYSFYCDCVKVVQLVDFPQPPSSWDDIVDEGHHGDSSDQQQGVGANQHMFAYVLSRGVEALDAEENTVNSIPNTVTLHRILYPSKDGDMFQLEEMKRFQHPDYRANSWLMKVSSNGRYITAGTYEGQVFCFNLRTGGVSAVLRDHEALEIRDIVFHPYKKMLFTSSDDGTVKAYAQFNES